jgi:hypothetical protein
MRVKLSLVKDGAFVLSEYMMKCYGNYTQWSRQISTIAFATCERWLSRRLAFEDGVAGWLQLPVDY